MSRSKDKKGEKKPKSQDSKPEAPAALDPAISSLFANSFGPSKPAFVAPPVKSPEDEDDEDEDEDEEGVDNDEELSELEDGDEDEEEDADDDEDAASESGAQADEDLDIPDVQEAAEPELESSNRKRKRKDRQPELEDVYMEKLAREEAKAIAQSKADRANKRQKTEKSDSDAEEGSEKDEAMSDDGMSPPPVHESLLPDTDSDLAKSQRTVFLGNVSSEAISSKSANKTLVRHLSSFFDQVAAPEKGQPAHKVESVRFRSTAYASAIPKKAAFAKKELMDATTKSTNAYVVYSSTMLAREAARRLNGSVVLDRHIRVDEIAHPAKVDHKRCIFVGNLGFVDDESNIDQANADEGKGKRHGNKTPSDVEEGLWRTFSTCGTVESVRVPRDSKTRVGKGFAYVQFTDENAVEAALLLNEKKFPPMLPRKLRITRAKAIKRNAKPGNSSTAAPTHTKGIYNPKMTSQQQSQMGRAGKLLGRAAAAQIRKGGPNPGAGRRGPNETSNIRAPENFIFEGHRATAGQGKSGLKLGGSGNGKKKGKPRTRSSNRAAQWKANNKGK